MHAPYYSRKKKRLSFHNGDFLVKIEKKHTKQMIRITGTKLNFSEIK